jgi:adenosine deaminase
VVKNLSDHNLKKLLGRGACITINSDDPAYFGGYMNENFLQTTKALDLSSIEIKLLARNSFEASFLSAQEKERWYREIESI